MSDEYYESESYEEETGGNTGGGGSSSVTPPPPKPPEPKITITIEPKEYAIMGGRDGNDEGDVHDFTATVSPSNNTEDVEWTLTNTKYARIISISGEHNRVCSVKGVSEGKLELLAVTKTSRKEGKARIKVEPAPPPPAPESHPYVSSLKLESSRTKPDNQYHYINDEGPILKAIVEVLEPEVSKRVNWTAEYANGVKCFEITNIITTADGGSCEIRPLTIGKGRVKVETLSKTEAGQRLSKTLDIEIIGDPIFYADAYYPITLESGIIKACLTIGGSWTSGRNLSGTLWRYNCSRDFYKGSNDRNVGARLIRKPLKGDVPMQPIVNEVLGINGDIMKPHDFVKRTDSQGPVPMPPSGSGAIEHNPFDTLEPYASISEVNDRNGNVFVRIPKFYTKHEANSSGSVQISMSKEPGFSLNPCFLDKDGKELDYVDVGKYLGSLTEDGVIVSQPNKKIATDLDIQSFRLACQANGVGYQQLDVWIYQMLKDLISVEFATFNTYKNIFKGYVHSNYNPDTEEIPPDEEFFNKTGESVGNRTIGETDIPGIASGATGCRKNDGKHSVVYRGIEDIWGHYDQFVDGINVKNNVIYVCTDPSMYEIDQIQPPYEKVSGVQFPVDSHGVPIRGTIIQYTGVFVGKNKNYFECPTRIDPNPSYGNGKYGTYYGGMDRVRAGATILYGGEYASGAGAGLYHMMYSPDSLESYTKWTCRLCRKPTFNSK